MATAAEVRRQYERWPYPHVPLFGAVRRLDTWQLNADYLLDRAGTDAAPERPRIWIAGCGTMQPYVFRLANPRAHILATDLSARSLRIAERRCNWHGASDIEFARIDLTEPSQLPPGPFDLIECYGVLMNLADPLAALRALASRLTERGVLRVMVYPHYGRRRIFQLQRVAKLCGLDFTRTDHPRALRRIVAALPPAHPLRYAFENYSDARNDAGLVDGFLHAGDRGFTGLEFGALCEGAGLVPAFWFHREWARPDAMAGRLGLAHTSQAFVLHYLDLWQELRGNYVCCLARADRAPSAATRLRPHPLLELGASTSIPDLARRLTHRVTGLVLPSRIDDKSHRISPRELRSILNLTDSSKTPSEWLERWRRAGVALGGPPRDERRPAPYGGIHTPPVGNRLEIGDGAANPFYSHLFDAIGSGPEHTAGALAPLAEQLHRWNEESEPLENATHPIGLTPFGTYRRMQPTIERWLERSEPLPRVSDWGDWPLRNQERQRVRAFLSAVGIEVADQLDDARCNELWNLLCSWEHLTLPGEVFD